jgi:hypothetical protein
MSTLEILVERTAPFVSLARVVEQIVALGEALREPARLGTLWVRFRGEHLPYDTTTLRLMLAQGPWIRGAGLERRPHVLPIVALSQGPSEVFVLRVARTLDGDPGAAPALTLRGTLPEERFDTGAEAMARLIERVIEAVSPDVAVIGPAAGAEAPSAAWATFTRRIQRDLIPASARLVPMGGGSLVLAHAEPPASETLAARNAIAQVRAAIDGSSPTQALEQWPAPAVSSQHPTDLVPLPLVLDSASLTLDVPRGHAVLSAENAPAHLGSTSLAVAVPSGPTLPFVAGRLTDPPHVRACALTELTGTMAAVDTSRPALPFVQQTSPTPIGLQLTLEQYAVLRAQLTVRGEDDQETLRLFGVTSPAAKEALQARFAERFRLDAAVQARFVDLVRTLTGELRRQTPPRSQ